MVENDKEGCVLAESRHSLSKVHFSTVQCTIKKVKGVARYEMHEAC